MCKKQAKVLRNIETQSEACFMTQVTRAEAEKKADR
jgi:hypothetical protein